MATVCSRLNCRAGAADQCRGRLWGAWNVAGLVFQPENGRRIKYVSFFILPKYDERDARRPEDQAQRDRDTSISLREANPSREVGLPVNTDPPPPHPDGCVVQVAGELHKMVELARQTRFRR